MFHMGLYGFILPKSSQYIVGLSWIYGYPNLGDSIGLIILLQKLGETYNGNTLGYISDILFWIMTESINWEKWCWERSIMWKTEEYIYIYIWTQYIMFSLHFYEQL